jgi:hypothetical protein
MLQLTDPLAFTYNNKSRTEFEFAVLAISNGKHNQAAAKALGAAAALCGTI